MKQAASAACFVMRRRDEHGFVLPLVLWICALLALIAASVLQSSRISAILAHNRVERAQARAAADAGVAWGIVGMLGASPDGVWPRDGRARTMRFAGAEVAVSIQDALGLIDVNAAPVGLLTRLFRSNGVPLQDSNAAATAILRWREPPGFPARPIAAPEELALVPGLPGPLLDRVLPFLTVRNGTAAIDPVSAPPSVLRAVPDIPESLLTSLIRARGEAAAPAGTLPLINDPDQQGPPTHRFATIRADAVGASGVRFIRETEIELNPDGEQTWRVLSWRQGRAGSN